MRDKSILLLPLFSYQLITCAQQKKRMLRKTKHVQFEREWAGINQLKDRNNKNKKASKQIKMMMSGIKRERDSDTRESKNKTRREGIFNPRGNGQGKIR